MFMQTLQELQRQDLIHQARKSRNREIQKGDRTNEVWIEWKNNERVYCIDTKDVQLCDR